MKTTWKDVSCCLASGLRTVIVRDVSRPAADVFFSDGLDRSCANEPGVPGHRPQPDAEAAAHPDQSWFQDQPYKRYFFLPRALLYVMLDIMKWDKWMENTSAETFCSATAFYTRKVKFTQETFCEKFQAILDGFPRLQDIHPFREFPPTGPEFGPFLEALVRLLTPARQGFDEHPLRCGPLPHCPRPDLDREAPD